MLKRVLRDVASWCWLLSVFFAPARYRVVKIVCSYSEVVL
jgi:hypothetical protein